MKRESFTNNPDLVFYIADDLVEKKPDHTKPVAIEPPVATSVKSTASVDDADDSWEEQLLKLRTNRGSDMFKKKEASIASILNRAPEVSTNSASKSNKPETVKATVIDVKKQQLNGAQKEVVYDYFIDSWQEKHNLSQADQDEIELLFKEDWVAAQSDVLSISEQATDSQTILLHMVEEIQSPLASTTPQSNLQVSEAAKPKWIAEELKADDAGQMPIDGILDDNKALTVALHVIAPVTSDKRLLCISEKDLVKRLSEQLESHLSNIIGGIVKTQVQKYTNTLLQETQASLLEVLPKIIHETIDYNIDSILKDIKGNTKQ